MSLPQERSTAGLVSYTWVARSRSGSSSFTALALNKPSSSSSSSSSFSSGDNKTTLAHFRAQQQNMAAFAAGMHARLGARSRVLGLNEQVVILLVLVMLACMHACMHTDLIRTKRVRATHTVNTHIFVIQMR